MHKVFIPIVSMMLLLSNNSFLKNESIDTYNFKETLSFDEIDYDKVESVQIKYSIEDITQILTFKDIGFKEYIDSLKGITYYLDKTNELDDNLYSFDFYKNISEYETNILPISLIINYDDDIHKITFGDTSGYTLGQYESPGLDDDKVYFIYKYEIETNEKKYKATYYSEYETILNSFIALILDKNNIPYFDENIYDKRYYLRPIKYENDGFYIESRKIDFIKDDYNYYSNSALHLKSDDKFNYKAWGLKMYDRDNNEIAALPDGIDYVYLYDLNNNQYQLHYHK